MSAQAGAPFLDSPTWFRFCPQVLLPATGLSRLCALVVVLYCAVHAV